MTNLIARLFGKKNQLESSATEESGEKTTPLNRIPPEAKPIEKPVVIPLTPHQLFVGSCQSVGKIREINEDSVFVMNTVLAGNGDATPFGFFIVADGMGGYQGGEIASGAAIRAMADTFVRKLYLPFLGVQSDHQNEPVQEIMKSGVSEAQQAVIRQVPGGGTTMTAVFIYGNQMTIAHVGDSRAYLIYPDNRIQVVTRDHSLVRRLQELGQITEQEAAVHPQRNVLYRAIGQGEPFDADVHTQEFLPPAQLLLCSDGLWGLVSDNAIARIVNQAKDVIEACQNLVQAANDAGGPDNISAILVKNSD